MTAKELSEKRDAVRKAEELFSQIHTTEQIIKKLDGIGGALIKNAVHEMMEVGDPWIWILVSQGILARAKQVQSELKAQLEQM